MPWWKSIGSASLAYYYEGVAGNDYEDIVTSIIPGNTLLTAHHVPVAGECEVKNVQAMKIMDAFGAGGSFAEIYLIDFEDDVVLLGPRRAGPRGHRPAQGGPRAAAGLSRQAGQGAVHPDGGQQRPVTLLAVVQDGSGKISLLAAEGESVPGPTLDIGNTNSRYRFSIGARALSRQWCQAGSAHHAAIGLGHVAERRSRNWAGCWGSRPPGCAECPNDAHRSCPSFDFPTHTGETYAFGRSGP